MQEASVHFGDRDDSELSVDDLPSLDPKDDEDEEKPHAPDYSDLLTTFDDDGSEDALAGELGDDFEIATPSEPPTDTSEGADIDIGPLLDEKDSNESWAGDEEGPVHVDPSWGLSAAEEGDPNDDAEGVDEGLADLLSNDLPALDEALDGEGPFESASVWLPEEQEDVLATSDTPWEPFLSACSGQICSVVLGQPTGALCAGRQIVRVTDDGVASQIATLKNTVRSMAPTGGSLLVSTLVGELYRIEGAEPVRLEGWRPSAEVNQGAAVDIQVHAGTGGSVLALVSNGTLMGSSDAGETWQRRTLPGPVLAIAGAPAALALIDDESGPTLFDLVDKRTVGTLSAVANLVEPGCELSRTGEVTVVALSNVGVALRSQDSGSFRPVPSCRSVTTALARPGGAFVALSDALRERSVVAWVDAGTLRVEQIGEIFACTGDENADEVVRITSLSFSEDRGTLWAAGGFGLRAWRRPGTAA